MSSSCPFPRAVGHSQSPLAHAHGGERVFCSADRDDRGPFDWTLRRRIRFIRGGGGGSAEHLSDVISYGKYLDCFRWLHLPRHRPRACLWSRRLAKLMLGYESLHMLSTIALSVAGVYPQIIRDVAVRTDVGVDVYNSYLESSCGVCHLCLRTRLSTLRRRLVLDISGRPLYRSSVPQPTLAGLVSSCPSSSLSA